MALRGILIRLGDVTVVHLRVCTNAVVKIVHFKISPRVDWRGSEVMKAVEQPYNFSWFEALNMTGSLRLLSYSSIAPTPTCLYV